MIPFLGILLVGIGVVSAFQMLRAKKRVRTMITTETLSSQELSQLHRAALDAVGPGAFRQLTEVAGVVRPSAAGPLASELNKTECVWYRTRVTRKFETRGSRANQRRRRTEVVSDFLSPTPFLVEDATGRTTVLPGDQVIEHAAKTHDRFEVYRPGHDRPLGLLDIPGITRNERTLGFQQEEWTVAPGTRCYVRGEARDDEGGTLTIAAPKDGSPFLMAAMSEQDLLATERRKSTVFRVLTVFCTPVGAILLALAYAL